MKHAFFYCYRRDINEATSYYMALIIKALEEVGYDVKTVHFLSDIKDPDLILTNTCICFTKAKLCFPLVKTLSWVQGVMYEEVRMNNFPLFKRLMLLFAEFFTIHSSSYLLLVSEKMREYYSSKFFYKKNNFTIVPCYNCHLNKEVDISKFETPTFVYAGGLSKWQCIDEMLETYALIEKQIRNAKLYLYCKPNDYLQTKIKLLGINNYEIKFVPVETLQNEMLKYKYGFLLREQNWVNAVATPTKMNSYLAGYVIPIFSNAVDDFKHKIDLSEFALMVDTPLDKITIAEKIIDFENKKHDFNIFINCVSEIFTSYYDDRMNIDKIKSLFR